MQGGDYMVSYYQMKSTELAKEIQVLQQRFESFKSKKYSLNMSRGKPCKEQLEISNPMVQDVLLTDFKDQTGFDLRNYGILDGIAEAKELFSAMLGVDSSQIIVGGNSSLNMMYDTISRAMHFGVPGSSRPWSKEDQIKFLCPVPGYDRHFAVTQSFGFEMIPIPMCADGPDMDQVEEVAGRDESVKGIWCVPLYSNPDGITYSYEVCKRLASMTTAAKDFRIMWDNAYGVHHLNPQAPDAIPEIVRLCEEEKNSNRVFEFASTSKITWAGSGIACLASSKENIAYVKSHLTFQTIGSDKINQLRHVRFLKNLDGIKTVMAQHAKILKPKFDAVTDLFHKELSETGIARWNEPKGGYFISLFVYPFTAREVVALCKECGVELTPAGATYPYGNDPKDSNIRIAPSFPPISELKPAIEILCVAVKLTAAKKLYEGAGFHE
jgi:aspartate/methionine/tyrosine aminotransferase